MVIDTGAAVTLLRKDLWLKTNTNMMSWKGPDLVRANGTFITVYGTASVVFKIGSCSFSMEAVVSDGLIAEVMLGSDFLEEHKCTIAAGHKLFTLGDGKVSVPLDSHNKKQNQITTMEIHLSQTEYSSLERNGSHGILSDKHIRRELAGGEFLRQ